MNIRKQRKKDNKRIAKEVRKSMQENPAILARIVAITEDEMGKQGVTRAPDEPLLDFVARAIGCTREQVTTMLRAVQDGCTLEEAERIAKMPR